MLSRVKELLSSRKFKLIFGAVLLQLILAILITFFIEFSNQRNDFGATWQLITEQPQVFWFNTGVIAFLGLIFMGLANSLIVGNGVLFAISYALMFANTQKLTWREFPLLPEDFTLLSETDSLMDMVSRNDLILTIIVIIVVIVVVNLISYFVKKKIKLPNFKNRKMIIARVSILIVGLIGVVSLTAPIRQLSSENSYIEVPWLNAKIVVWDQSSNYRNNGFILSFIYNLQQRQMEKPEGYSEATIRAIVEKYQKLADQQTVGDNQDVDIIYIMNESFSDPAKLMAEFPYSGDDPIPFTRDLMTKTSSGQISTPAYGGGTADVEFEALTGLSMFYIDAMPYTNMVSRQPNFPSLVSLLEKYDYETTAIHPFSGKMYKRDIVYRNFGFDRFIDDTGIEYNAANTFNTKISDRFAYNQVLEQLDSSDKNQLIFLITMQNHMPFTETVPSKSFHTTVNVDEQHQQNLNSYMTVLNESDKALQDLITKLEKRQKKTLLIFFGDHLPGIYGERDGVELVGNREMLMAHYQTPLLIYANYQIKQKNLGTISPIFINNEILASVGIKRTAFYELLAAVKQQNEILNRRVIEVSPVSDSEILNDFRMIQYDTISGKKYALEAGFF